MHSENKEESIAIFSRSPKFLDLIEEMLMQYFQQTSIRLDSLTPPDSRKNVTEEFAATSGGILLGHLKLVGPA